MFRVFLFILLILSVSCETETTFNARARSFLFMFELGNPDLSKYRQLTTYAEQKLKNRERTVAYFDRKTIKGDFNGDGQTETLYESMRSRLTGKEIDSVDYFDDDYDYLVDTISNLEPTLKLRSAHGLPALKLNHSVQVFGILGMINLGNINASPGDEIAVVVDWADWSNCNDCDIYSLCGGQWQEVFSFETRDYYLYNEGTEIVNIKNIIRPAKQGWDYYHINVLDDIYTWRTLKNCECEN